MTETMKKIPSTKRKTSAVKPAAIARKPAVAKPVAAKAVAAAKPENKIKKSGKADGKAGDKVIRASFTMPQSDYAKIVELKQACLKEGIQVKKSELIRVGLHALCKLSSAQLKKEIAQIARIKVGRPKKNKNVPRK